MKNNIISKYTSLFLTVLLLSGCVTTQNLIGEKYSIETVPNSNTYFTHLFAVEYDGEFRVSGRFRLKNILNENDLRLVEVTLVGADGAVIETQKVPYFPQDLTGRSNKLESRFTARFIKIPPAGTVIRLIKEN